MESGVLGLGGDGCGYGVAGGRWRVERIVIIVMDRCFWLGTVKRRPPSNNDNHPQIGSGGGGDGPDAPMIIAMSVDFATLSLRSFTHSLWHPTLSLPFP